MKLINILHFVRWVLRLLIVAAVGYWILQIFAGDLGASPALKLNHKFGKIALRLLTLNISYGIVLAIWPNPPNWFRYWNRERRFWGVSAFIILCIHILFYFVDQAFEAKAFSQIVTTTYLIFGLFAFLILAALAFTSNNWGLRKLGGKRWKKLHRLIYVVQILLFGHILLIEKADLIEFGVWLGTLALAQLLRFVYLRIKKHPLSVN